MPDMKAFVDTETTGLNPCRHRIIEVSVARVEGDDWESLALRTWRFHPGEEDLFYAEPKALEVNGYRPDHPDWEGRPFCGSEEAQGAWSEIADRLGGCVLTNQNVLFDERFIWAELQNHGLVLDGSAKPWGSQCEDLQVFSRAIAKQHRSKRWRLSKIYELLNGPRIPLHRAEADVLAAIWVYAWGQEQLRRAEIARRIRGAVRNYIQERLIPAAALPPG